ncbi:MAG TPA: hypothetical protein VFK13_08260 [Gemmatimonadaceae bacterium]|nr:hypothetical protein [Gemmatimonadaceae bacterium]
MLELRETVATALSRLGELEASAARWSAHDASVTQVLLNINEEDAREEFWKSGMGQMAEQQEMFEVLEAFLAAWARVSLLLFPTGGNKTRGKALVQAFQLDGNSTLANRDLRDAWMHFDERLDAAVRTGGWGDRHRWVSSSMLAERCPKALRLFEVDALIIHFRDRSNQPCTAKLRDCRDALEGIQSGWHDAWHRLT